MNFTLYCYGDIELFSGGLRAVAMLFDPFTGSLVGESGLQIGTLTALAFMVSLAGIAITGISRQRVNVDHLLVLLLVFGVMFIPKTDLNIEDVITGKVDIVEDVPIGVAAVGGRGVPYQSGPGRELRDRFFHPVRCARALGIAMDGDGLWHGVGRDELAPAPAAGDPRYLSGRS